ncbi:MAG: tRNA modification GTPase [Planctomycetaceae bacterium]|nr:tRNA modification GTPase [Planctomycetaceae bacterium]
MSAGASSNDLHDTIVAIATGPSAASRGIVRLTGPHVATVVERVFVPSDTAAFPDRIAQRLPGRIYITTNGGRSIEQGLATLPADLWYWPSARTYTGQPSAEFHVAGLPYLLEQIVQECLRAGARMAAPGEFTMRAFLAGRLDLLQAQAVLQVIEANSEAQLQAALSQLAGGLSTPLQELRDQLIMVLAHLEAGLDFVEEDIEFISREQLLGDLQAVRSQVEKILEQLRQRREAGKLPRVVLVGPPNAGKSSLFNALLGQSAAIVSPQSGTTRDYLSARLSLGAVEIELIDTAGLDDSFVDPLDWLSQQQTTHLLPTADVLVLCWDVEQPANEIHDWLTRLPQPPALLVLGKSDRAVTPEHSLPSLLPTSVRVSTLHGHGLGELRSQLANVVHQRSVEQSPRPTGLSVQAMDDLEQIDQALAEALIVASGQGGEELVAAELHRAIDRLGRLVGTIYTDDILDSIFSRFCIGK